MPTLSERIRARLDRSAHRPLLPVRPTRGDLARHLLPPELYDAAMRVEIDDRGHGIDAFGASREGVAMALVVTRFLYERYFRVSSYGVDQVPASGPVVLAANHSGMLPLDAMMISHDLIRRRGRVPRVVMDHFVPDLPFVASVFTGGGGIGGSRGNFHAILSNGGIILVFPEGTRGIGKGWAKRYQLERFTEGHAELAIRHQAPIVPVGVVGAEEQWPQIGRIDVKAFGAPYLPIPATPLPLPTHYHLHYGAPIPVAGRFAPACAQDAEAVQTLAAEVKAAVQALVDKGRKQRPGVFA